MPRHAAFLCLRSGSPTPLREVDRFAARRGLDERDTALARRLVGTEIRRRGTLRAVVFAFAHGKPKAEFATLLRIGLAQILFLDRIPPHAAVSETVRCTADFLGLGKGRVANGILRNALRALKDGHSGDPQQDLVGVDRHLEFPAFRDPEEHLHLWAEDALSVPAPLHKRWTAAWGRERADELARIATEESPLSIRATHLAEGGRDPIRSELREAGIQTSDGAHPDVLLVPPSDAGGALRQPSFHAGRTTVQGEHALRAAELMGDLAGLDVLDLCSAPGGKTAVLAARQPRSLVSMDVGAGRLGRTRSGLGRLGLAEVPQLVASDGTGALGEGVQFDAALLDVPCSNTGVLSQRPSARWRYGPKSQSDLTTLQGQLLNQAADRIRPGGHLVYSTCSLEAEENARRIQTFLKDRPDWELEETAESFPATFEDGGPVDGGYAARLRAPASS